MSDMVRARAAASSIASGSPSRRRQISTTAARVAVSASTGTPRSRRVDEQHERWAHNSEIIEFRNDKRSHGVDGLAAHVERFAAGGDHRHPRAFTQKDSKHLSRETSTCSQLSSTTRASASRNALAMLASRVLPRC